MIEIKRPVDDVFNIKCQTCGQDCHTYKQVNTAQIGECWEMWCYCEDCNTETFHPIRHSMDSSSINNKENLDAEPQMPIVDCLFTDNYGTPVNHGTIIMIESNYNYPYFNNRKAMVEWYAEKGMYRFTFTDGRLKTPHDFYGIHSFRVVQ